MLKTELRDVNKNGQIYYILDVYIVYDSGKRYKLCSSFLQKNQYDIIKKGVKD